MDAARYCKLHADLWFDFFLVLCVYELIMYGNWSGYIKQ